MLNNKHHYPPKGTIIFFDKIASEVYMSPTLHGDERHYFNSENISGNVIVLDYGYVFFSEKFKLKVLFVDNGIIGWIWPGINFLDCWKTMVIK